MKIVRSLCAVLAMLAPLPAVSQAEDAPAFALQFGSYGYGDGQFQGVAGIGIDRAGNIYAADLRGNRIQKFDGNGNFISKFGSTGSGTGQFDLPYDVAIAADGAIYVDDYNNSRIQVFDSQFRFLRQWNPSYAGGPMAIALSPADDALYVSYYDGMIVKFSTSGVFLTSWRFENDSELFSYYYGFAVGPSGAVYICDPFNGVLHKYGPNGEPLTSWSAAQPGWNLDVPEGVGADALENVYVGNANSPGRIVKYTSTGGYLSHWGVAGIGPGQFVGVPSDIVVNTAGDVYAADQGHTRIVKFSNATTPIRTKSWGQLKRRFR